MNRAKEVIPSVETNKRLAVLSQEFKTDGHGFTLAVNITSSKEQAAHAVAGMTERFQRFVENGYSHKGTGLDPAKYVVRLVA